MRAAEIFPTYYANIGQVAFKEIPKRELRVMGEIQSLRGRVQELVAFKEIPKRELRGTEFGDDSEAARIISVVVMRCIQRNPKKGIESL